MCILPTQAWAAVHQMGIFLPYTGLLLFENSCSLWKSEFAGWMPYFDGGAKCQLRCRIWKIMGPALWCTLDSANVFWSEVKNKPMVQWSGTQWSCWIVSKTIYFTIVSSTGIPVMYCLLEVVSVFPEKLASRFVEKIDWIKVSFVFSSISTYLFNYGIMLALLWPFLTFVSSYWCSLHLRTRFLFPRV